MKKIDWTKLLLWIVYLSLLAVLLPHTAWAFDTFEPEGGIRVLGISVVAWLAALSFELAIATLTHRLAVHIDTIPNSKNKRKLMRRRYANAYALGLLLSVFVSALANVAHAVEFGKRPAILEAWSIPFGLYAVMFGAVLPVVSLLFARVLSNASEANTVEEISPMKYGRLQTQLKEAKSALREAKATVKGQDSELARTKAETEEMSKRFGDASGLFGNVTAERIQTAVNMWPDAPRAHIATIAHSSPSYVTEVLDRVSENGNMEGVE